MSAAKSLRRLWFGGLTLTGLARRGVFIPYRYADRLAPPGGRGRYPVFESLFARHRPAFARVLAAIDRHAARLAAFDGAAPPMPRWGQDWFPRLDGAAAYALVRDLAPRRIVEVGSGHSTRFLVRALRDGGIDGAVTALDPAPRASLAALGVTHLPTTAEAADPALFDALGPGDLLFIDSSHLVLPGGDVDRLLTTVVPRLPAGVVIHVHDIFLPDDYPAAWAWRGYSEQVAVAALLAGGGFQPLFASHYVATRMATAVADTVLARLPQPAGSVETSLWLRKLASPLA